MASTSRQNEVGMGLRIALDTSAIDFAATQRDVPARFTPPPLNIGKRVFEGLKKINCFIIFMKLRR
jgi:hypothetical protein